jgi:hypothetical protein
MTEWRGARTDFVYASAFFVSASVARQPMTSDFVSASVARRAMTSDRMDCRAALAMTEGRWIAALQRTAV